MSQVLVVNSGSSSLKYQLLECADAADGDAARSVVRLAKGLAERIGQDGSRVVYEPAQGEPVTVGSALPDHQAALDEVRRLLERDGHDLSELAAVGHRVVHGGERFREPTVVDDEVEAAIEALVPLAPLHNPANLLGLRVLRALLPQVPQVAVFDTAFHASIPPVAATYAIDAALAQAQGVRRYGFHGTSVSYVSHRAAVLLGVPRDQVNLIVAHLGNGASMTAVRHGRSVDTSMGLSPLEGLVMGTRSGDLDPAVVFHLVRNAGMSLDEVDAMLNTGSGLRGLCGESDMRAVRELANSGDPAAQLALEVYAYRIRRYVGSYLAVLPDLHALVFTAGVGENDSELRAEVVGGLGHLGFRLDRDANARRSKAERRIDPAAGGPAVLVVPTDEEAEIAAQALAVVGSS